MAADSDTDGFSIPYMPVAVLVGGVGLLVAGSIFFAFVAWWTGATGPILTGKGKAVGQAAWVVLAVLVVLGPLYGVWKVYQSVTSRPGR